MARRAGNTPDINSADDRRRLSAPALRTFFRIAERWKLSAEEQADLLGGVARSTLFEWKKAQPDLLSVDQLMRVSFVIGAYEALQRLFSRSSDIADDWVHRANSGAPFFGVAPLAFARTRGLPGLAQVRQYLDDASGGPPSRAAAEIETVHAIAESATSARRVAEP
jgi:hypothetical protein